MSYDPYSPSFQLFGDSTKVVNYQRDAHNYITQLFASQLPAVQTSFFNVHMSQGIIVQPHWHTNVTELVFLISGEVMASVFNPYSRKLMTYKLKPGQVSQFPKGWFHWIIALTQNVHLLTIFDQPTPDIVYGSDFLRFVPTEVLNRAYCVQEDYYEKAVAPLNESVILGPPIGCEQTNKHAASPPYRETQTYQPPPINPVNIATYPYWPQS
ncbi:MAG: cupin domain-containing protein [Bacillus sp. (in: firmicutes)]